MAKPFVQIDLSSSGRDFRPFALELGVPLADSTGANARVVRRWLGRFAAEPQWDGETLLYYLVDDRGGRREDVDCRPVTRERLQGVLRAEVGRMQERIEQVSPGSHEQSLYRGLQEALRGLTANSPSTGLETQFFEYREGGQWRLVWCWGFQSKQSGGGAAVLCRRNLCQELFLRHPQDGLRCPRCRWRPWTQRIPWRLAAAALLLIMLGGSVAGYWWLKQTTAVLVGRVIGGEDNKMPVVGAVVRIEGTDRSTKTDQRGEFRLDQLPSGPLEFRVIAPRYDAKTMAAEMRRGTETQVDVSLSGGVFPQGKVVDAATGQPLGEAKVRIAAAGNNTMLTGPDGSFRFPGFQDASAKLQVEMAGYRSEAVNWSRQSSNVLVKLMGSSKLAGRIVCDGFKDRPVAGAKVRIAKMPELAVSDGQGRFRLENLSGRHARLEVEADGFVAQQIDVDLLLDQEAVRNVSLVGTSGIAGTVVDPVCTPPRPIAGATIAIQDSALTTKTDADGKYQLQGLPPGSMKLAVEPPAGYRSTQVDVELKAGESLPKDFQLASGEGFSGTVVWTSAGRSVPVAGAMVKIRGTSLGASTDGEGRFTIAGPPPHLTQVPLAVSAEGFLPVEVQRGRETAQEPISLTGATIVRGRVMTDASDPSRPVAGAKVRIENSPLAVSAAEDGSFVLEGARSGSGAKLVVEAPGFAAEAIARDLAPGPNNPLGDVLLRGNSELAGKVTDSAGHAVANADVRIADFRHPVKTDAQGAYQLTGIPAGRQKIEVVAADCGEWQESRTIEPGKNVIDMVLGRQATLTVTVVDKADGKRPIAEAEVRVTSPARSQKTDASGQAVFTKVPAQRLKLEVAASGFCSEQLEATAESPKAAIAVPLAREAVLDVHVFSELDRKTPIAGATVAIAGRLEKPVTDNKGLCQVRGLRPGPAAIKITAAGYRVRGGTKELPSGPTPLEIPLIGAADLSVQVVNDLDNRPVPGTKVLVRAAGLEQRGQTDVSGEYKVTGVPACDAEVVVTAPNFPPGQVAQRLNAGENRATVRLKPQTQLIVTAIDARTKAPVAGARIALPGLSKAETADANGRAVFSDIPAGTVPVAATARGYCEKQVSAAALSPRASVTVPLERGVVLVGEAINAINKKAVPGAVVTVRVGDVTRTAVVDATGHYRVEDVPAGHATIEIAENDFSTRRIEKEIQADVPIEPIRTVLNPRLAAGEIRLVLTWGKKPRDLDAHLYGEVGGSHVYFQGRVAAAGAVTLDADSKEGEGPETITLKRPPAGRYAFWVEDSTHSDEPQSKVLATQAQAEVTIYEEDRAPRSFPIKADRGKAASPFWHGFNILIGSTGKAMIVPVNEFGSSLPSK